MRTFFTVVFTFVVLGTSAARADDVLHLGTATLDRPTLLTLGVRWAVTGDDDHDASVSVRYRQQGTAAWKDAMPLFRVRNELVSSGTAVSEFAGSVFDLAPATTWELELSAHDPDGGDQTVTLTGTTRGVPASEPQHPRVVNVDTAASLRTALSAAQPGDVITLAAGTYTGEFTLDASGTEADPIVIRGVDRDTVVLDGNEGGSNVLAIEGSYTHVERLTLQHDVRAIRFHGTGAKANVVRRVRIRDVRLGIGSNPDQQDFYLCDNDITGRLTWPLVYADDSGAHANDDGVHVEGDGHVICHNALTGFGDAIKNEQDAARAYDIYGNDVNDAYDNAVELDQAQGNARCFRNRFTNTYMPLSFQPIFGGPAYALRNVVVNSVNEPLKLHNSTVGVVVLNNTFVSAGYALQVSDDTTARVLVLKNNLFLGPNPPASGRVVNWSQPMDPSTVELDFDGWFPDGQFRFGYGAGSATYADFAAVQAGGLYEAHGHLLSGSPFADGLLAPASYQTPLTPTNAVLASGSDAADRGTVLPNVTDGFLGTAPDLGAQELGCTPPVYGVRPEGMDETNESLGCGSTPTGGGAGGGGGGAAGGGGGTAADAGSGGGATGGGDGGGGGGMSATGGCACTTVDGGLTAWALLALGVAARRLRARRH